VLEPGGGVPLGVDIEHGEVGHESGRRRPVPVLLARLEEHAVAGTDHLGLTAAPLGEADALEDVDRLPVRVRVPGRARAGREVHAACAQPQSIQRARDGVDEDRAREPLGQALCGVDGVPRHLHECPPGPIGYPPTTQSLPVIG